MPFPKEARLGRGRFPLARPIEFRVLDDGKASGRRMMLGNWIAREKNGGWFTLEELPEFDKAIGDLLVRSPY